MLSLVFTLITVFVYAGNAQTQLTAGQELTNQVAGSWYYHVSEDAPLPGILHFNVYNNTAGSYTVCGSDCANDISSCSFSCSGPGSCTIEFAACGYLRGHDYYFFVTTTNASTSFSVQLTEAAQTVTALTSTPIAWNSSASGDTYSVFSFEVSDTDALNYVKISLADGSSVSSAGVAGSGSIYRPGDNKFGEYSVCARTQTTFFSYQSLLGLLSPYCPYEGGKYYVIFPNSFFNGYDLQISFQTYNTEATAIPIGSSSYTVSASQTNQFQFFYYDQGNSAITTITYATGETSISSRIITNPLGSFDTESKRIYPIRSGCPVTQTSLSQGGGDEVFRSYPCSPSQGRVFFGFFPRSLPYTITIDRDDNTDPSTEYNTTSIGTVTQLDHTTGTQKMEHYWKIRDGLDLARGDDYFEIFYDNTNNTVSAQVFISHDAPSGVASCMSTQDYVLVCPANSTCNFGVPACIVLGKGAFYFTVVFANTPPTNAPGSFEITISGTTRIARDSSNTFNFPGREIQAYSYSPSRQIVDIITIDRDSGNSIAIYGKLAAAVGKDTCTQAQFADITCGSFPCSYPIFCNQNNVGDLGIVGLDQTATRVNYTITAASYDENSLYGRKMVVDQSLTFTVLPGNTMYVYFQTQGHEGFKITVDKTTRTSATYTLFRNDDCTDQERFASTSSQKDEYVFTNKPAMDSNGEYYFTVSPNSFVENNTFTLLLQTGDKNKIQFCNAINSANVTFCSAYISNGNGYPMDNSEAEALDLHARIIYSHYAFHDASAQCMSDVKDFICSELFQACSDNGATDNTCDKSCHDALSNCPSDEACLYETCVTYLPCVLLYPSSSTNVIYSLGLMLMIALLQFI